MRGRRGCSQGAPRTEEDEQDGGQHGRAAVGWRLRTHGQARGGEGRERGGRKGKGRMGEDDYKLERGGQRDTKHGSKLRKAS